MTGSDSGSHALPERLRQLLNQCAVIIRGARVQPQRKHIMNRKALQFSRQGAFFFLAMAAGLTSLAGAASAQELALEEIIVTAQKREQRLQDVGIAVTVFSGEQVRELGFTNTTDITAMTPGLNYTIPNAESSQINFFLRGVGLNDFADANENPVAVYVDDVYRPAMGGLSFQLFDVDRVEVLRGPQGSLFGRNTTGGLVHYVTRRPTQELEGYADLALGQFSQVKAEAALGGALSGNAAARVSVAMHQHDGYTENRVGPDYNETDAAAVRGQLALTPSDDFDLLVNAWYSNNDAAVGAWQHQATKFDASGNSVPLAAGEQTMTVDCNADGMLDAGDMRPAPGTDCFGYRDTDGDPHAGDYDRDGRVEVESSGFSLNANWDLGGFTATSITGYQQVERLQSEDTEAGPYPLLMPTFRADTDTFTQELRAAGGNDALRWLAGLYYFDNEVAGHYTLDLRNLDFLNFEAHFTQETQSTALFGQVEFQLAEQVTLIAGARWASEEKELDYINVDTSGFLTGIIGLPTNVAFDFDMRSVGDLAVHDEDTFSGKLEIDWRPNDDLLVYAGVSRGVKSPGFNVGFLDGNFIFASNTVDTIGFDKEALTSFEAGFKASLAGGRARLNGSAFYYDYKDFQTFRFELLNQIIFNADASVTGGELELQAALADGWDLMLGMSVLDPKAKDIPSPAGGAQDRTMVSAPEFSATALIRYQWPALGGNMTAQLWGNWQSAVYFDIQNVPVSRQDGYGVGNLRVSWSDASDRWELAAFAHNIADEEYLSYTFDFTGTFGFNQQAYGRPRWVGASVRVQF